MKTVLASRVKLLYGTEAKKIDSLASEAELYLTGPKSATNIISSATQCNQSSPMSPPMTMLFLISYRFNACLVFTISCIDITFNFSCIFLDYYKLKLL